MFLHIDIDAFFASAECVRDPSLKEKPICVGSRSNLEIFSRKRQNIRLMNDNGGAFVAPVFHSAQKKSFQNYFIDHIDGKHKIRGIVTTASYPARGYGVKTGMPIAQALQLCPHMVVIPSDYRYYHTLSHEVHRFIRLRIPQVEQYSIDEFFGDIQGWIKDEEVYKFAQKLQLEIKAIFGLPVSIGIARSKWIAKLATDKAKPFGIHLVEDVASYIEDIPIKEFPGIGKGYQKRLEAHYLYTLGDVRRSKYLLYSWKKPGIQLYDRITGTDNEKISISEERKSIGISRTFDPVYDVKEVRRRVMIMARHIAYMVMEADVNPTYFYLKINYEYGIKAKQTIRVERIFSERLYKQVLSGMYESIVLSQRGAIKLSVNVSNFAFQQKKTLCVMTLDEDLFYKRLSMDIHAIRRKFGLDIVKTANEL